MLRIPLNLFIVVLSEELVDVFLAAMLLGLAQLLKDLDGLTEGLDGRPLALELLGSVDNTND